MQKVKPTTHVNKMTKLYKNGLYSLKAVGNLNLSQLYYRKKKYFDKHYIQVQKYIYSSIY